MKYYIIAGERSGDLHAGNLIKSLRKYDDNVLVRGFGGEYMKEAGADVVVHYKEMAYMGFVEVLKNLGTISKYVIRCKKDILQFKPDAVILIDYAGFNQRITGFAKEKGFTVFYYITPKVWAWYQRRALQLKRTVHKMFVILPFEKDFFSRYNCEAEYVGNPVLDAIKAHHADSAFLQKNDLLTSSPIVALLPGSRSDEVKSMIPVLTEVVRRFPGYQFAVAAVGTLDSRQYDQIAAQPNVKLIDEDAYNLLLNARAAVVTSGTATLETALFKVPQTVVYKISAMSYTIAKLLVKVKFISLVNLIAGKEVIRELIQEKANAVEIGNELERLVSDQPYRTRILQDYETVYNTLDIGSASENTARQMVTYLKAETEKLNYESK